MKINDVTSWRVLVVDDEPDNLTLASDLLRFRGATVANAEDGRTALTQAAEFQPHVVLLDLGMPEMDGWEVFKRLRADPHYNQTAIIALTAFAMPQDADRVRSAGFDGYITKPFRVRSLPDDIAAVLKTFAEKQPALSQLPSESPVANPATDVPDDQPDSPSDQSPDSSI